MADHRLDGILGARTFARQTLKGTAQRSFERASNNSGAVPFSIGTQQGYVAPCRFPMMIKSSSRMEAAVPPIRLMTAPRNSSLARLVTASSSSKTSQWSP